MAVAAAAMAVADVAAQKLRINFCTTRRGPRAAEGPGDGADAAWDLDSAADPYRMECGLDWFQAMRMGALNGVWAGPNWYGWSCLVSIPAQPETFRPLLLKVVLDGAVFAPWLHGTMLALEGLTRTGSPAAAGQRVAADLPGLLAAWWAVWPAAELLGAALLPPAGAGLLRLEVGLGWLLYCAAVYGRRPPAAGLGDEDDDAAACLTPRPGPNAVHFAAPAPMQPHTASPPPDT
eukprot:EG_transcript_27487